MMDLYGLFFIPQTYVDLLLVNFENSETAGAFSTIFAKSEESSVPKLAELADSG